MSLYKDAIISGVEELAENTKTMFLGEGLINAGRIYHTLDNVPKKKCLEFPIAENLIMGSAIGMAMSGFKPVVIFQRMDFMLIAADQIINHLALLPKLSGGKLKLPVIIRAIVGDPNKKFNAGLQHTKNLTYIFEPWIETFELDGRYSPTDILNVYKLARFADQPILIVEHKRLYDE